LDDTGTDDQAVPKLAAQLAPTADRPAMMPIAAPKADQAEPAAGGARRPDQPPGRAAFTARFTRPL
jgi:hypothetical protein